jgi:molybdopterin synthase catalytic subunit
VDISSAIAKMKENPEFSKNVGMVLIHNGVVRSWSRKDGKEVECLEVVPDLDKVESIRLEYMKKTGIYDIKIEALEGRFQPGDDLLFIIVAGDLRENVKPVLAELLDRIKAEAVAKKEIMK